MAHKRIWIAFLQPDSTEDPEFLIAFTESDMWDKVLAYAKIHRKNYECDPLMEPAIHTPEEQAREYFDRLATPMLWWDWQYLYPR